MKQYCSRKCYAKVSGGYRKGSVRSKAGYYKSIYCESTYELAWVIYQLDNKKEFTRFETILEHNGEKYVPDFLQDGKIVEIKGYMSANVDKQIRVAIANGYEINVLTKDKLKKEFEWVKQNYSYKRLEELYDSYKPKYKYTCDCCNKEFKTDTKKKTAKIFCSRDCLCKHLKANPPKSGGINQYNKHLKQSRLGVRVSSEPLY